MSYRLINANTIAESYTEVHDMPCIYADLPRGLDGCHYDMRGMDELQAENAKLFALLKHESEQTEKLRELVRFIMHQCNDGNPRCDECIGWNDGECVALQHMCELGVD